MLPADALDGKLGLLVNEEAKCTNAVMLAGNFQS
jgi:hypothetical protein